MITSDVAQRVVVNLAAIRSRLAAAAERSGRSPAVIRLVAVSKTFGPEYVRAAHAVGLRDFGENKVQEALSKREATADLDIHWHLIGHLQSNKANKATAFAWIQSVDRLDLLRKLDATAATADAAPNLLLQVDLAGEATKHGAPEADLRELLGQAAACTAVRVRGLMLLPPWSDDPEASRPWFRRLRELRNRLLDEGVAPQLLTELSMGMSHDFEVAIEEGATMVRIGTALFGRRATPA